MLSAWKDLAVFLIVKYNDMVAKPTKGRAFLRTQTGLGARVKREGFPAKYAERLVRETGDKFRSPE